MAEHTVGLNFTRLESWMFTLSTKNIGTWLDWRSILTCHICLIFLITYGEIARRWRAFVGHLGRCHTNNPPGTIWLWEVPLFTKSQWYEISGDKIGRDIIFLEKLTNFGLHYYPLSLSFFWLFVFLFLF